MGHMGSDLSEGIQGMFGFEGHVPNFFRIPSAAVVRRREEVVADQSRSFYERLDAAYLLGFEIKFKGTWPNWRQAIFRHQKTSARFQFCFRSCPG